MKYQRQRDVLEVAECIGGAWRWTEQMEQMELEVNRVSTHQRQSEQSELVRTCQGLLLLHVGPNGDGSGVRNITSYIREDEANGVKDWPFRRTTFPSEFLLHFPSVI
jgi:hypothetical protein